MAMKSTGYSGLVEDIVHPDLNVLKVRRPDPKWFAEPVDNAALLHDERLKLKSDPRQWSRRLCSKAKAAAVGGKTLNQLLVFLQTLIYADSWEGAGLFSLGGMFSGQGTACM